jgi:hypothetical protein
MGMEQRQWVHRGRWKKTELRAEKRAEVLEQKAVYRAACEMRE